MGLYDNIKYKDILYQTKSLDCLLDNYLIDDNGQFLKEDFDIIDMSNKDSKDIKSLCGILSKTNRKWVFFNYTGEIYFYNYIDDIWTEFVCVLYSGRVHKIRRIK